MSRGIRTEARIIVAFRQVDAGRIVDDSAWEQGVSKQTIYALRAK